MKAIAREHVYWPGLNSEIERLVRLCEACQEAAKKSPKSPLHPWEIPSEVFERIHTDFAGPCSDGSTYLLIVDSYSKWPEVFKMPNMSAAATVICMRSFVHRFGIPKEIVSDNGTQFRSAEFAQFCQEFGIKQTFIPPFHPQSNGQAERFVDTFKRSMKKCKEEGTDWVQKMLFAYRTTPNSALNGRSPDELFLGRNLRTKLSLVHPEQQDKKVSFSDQPRKEYTRKMANQFDAKHGTKFVKFFNGESVFLLNYRFGKTHWLPGKIIEQVKNSPTYRVEVPSLGRTVHRHANQLRRRLDDVSSPPAEVVNHATPPRVASPPSVPAQQNMRSPRPKREVKPPRRLMLDSSKKRYEYE
jgi:transposase InsO family protein